MKHTIQIPVSHSLAYLSYQPEFEFDGKHEEQTVSYYQYDVHYIIANIVKASLALGDHSNTLLTDDTVGLSDAERLYLNTTTDWVDVTYRYDGIGTIITHVYMCTDLDIVKGILPKYREYWLQPKNIKI